MRFIRWSSALTRLAYRLAYPGARISGMARIGGAGEIRIGRGASIGDRAAIAVPEGASLDIGESCYIGRDVEIGPASAIRIGADTSIQDRCILLGQVSIGANCIFAPNVYISSGRHWHDLEPSMLIRDQDQMAASGNDGASHQAPVMVDEDCWLGINVVVLRGVHIGKGAVVGANSVVNRDVEPYSIVAGAPARPIKLRLKFAPPARLSSDEPGDLPYFYSGFRTSRADREASSPRGGVLAPGAFSIAITPQGPKLVLQARSMPGAAATIRFGDQRQDLLPEWRELTFDIRDHTGGIFDFAVEAQQGPPGVIVKAAWT